MSEFDFFGDGGLGCMTRDLTLNSPTSSKNGQDNKMSTQHSIVSNGPQVPDAGSPDLGSVKSLSLTRQNSGSGSGSGSGGSLSGGILGMITGRGRTGSILEAVTSPRLAPTPTSGAIGAPTNTSSTPTQLNLGLSTKADPLSSSSSSASMASEKSSSGGGFSLFGLLSPPALSLGGHSSVTPAVPAGEMSPSPSSLKTGSIGPSSPSLSERRHSVSLAKGKIPAGPGSGSNVGTTISSASGGVTTTASPRLAPMNAPSSHKDDGTVSDNELHRSSTGHGSILSGGLIHNPLVTSSPPTYASPLLAPASLSSLTSRRNSFVSMLSSTSPDIKPAPGSVMDSPNPLQLSSPSLTPSALSLGKASAPLGPAKPEQEPVPLNLPFTRTRSDSSFSGSLSDSGGHHSQAPPPKTLAGDAIVPRTSGDGGVQDIDTETESESDALELAGAVLLNATPLEAALSLLGESPKFTALKRTPSSIKKAPLQRAVSASYDSTRRRVDETLHAESDREAIGSRLESATAFASHPRGPLTSQPRSASPQVASGDHTHTYRLDHTYEHHHRSNNDHHGHRYPRDVPQPPSHTFVDAQPRHHQHQHHHHQHSRPHSLNRDESPVSRLAELRHEGLHSRSHPSHDQQPQGHPHHGPHVPPPRRTHTEPFLLHPNISRDHVHVPVNQENDRPSLSNDETKARTLVSNLHHHPTTQSRSLVQTCKLCDLTSSTSSDSSSSSSPSSVSPSERCEECLREQRSRSHTHKSDYPYHHHHRHHHHHHPHRHSQHQQRYSHETAVASEPRPPSDSSLSPSSSVSPRSTTTVSEFTLPNLVLPPPAGVNTSGAVSTPASVSTPVQESTIRESTGSKTSDVTKESRAATRRSLFSDKQH